MTIGLPLGELIFGFACGFLLGSRLQASTGEGRVRVGYVFGIVAAVLLYGAYDFYYYHIGSLALRKAWFYPGLSGSFLLGMLGIILGRELVGRRRGAPGG